MKKKSPAAGCLELHVIRPIVRRITGAMAGYHKRIKKQIGGLRTELLEALRERGTAEAPESSGEDSKRASL